MSTNERPDPSWSVQKMTQYMEERYGKQSRFRDARTGEPVTVRELVRLFDTQKKRK